MNGKQNSPGNGQETSGTAEKLQDGGVSRHAGLDSPAALSGPQASSDTDAAASASEISSNHGITRTSVDPGEPVWGVANIGEMMDEESDVSVRGYAHDDEDTSHVECTMSVGKEEIVLNFSPDRARGLAEELSLAADAADEGGDR